MNFPTQDFVALAPVGILSGGALVLLMSEVFLDSTRRGYQASLTVLFAILAAISAITGGSPGVIFNGQATVDSFSTFVTVIVCGGMALSALVGAGWLRARQAERGEFYALALFGASGMALLGLATDLLFAFISIEVMSISTYALAAYIRRGKKPAEAAFKYFILGAFSSALLLYGAALVYGATGSTLFVEISKGSRDPALLVVGLGLVAVGLSFKVAAVPFHIWTPDVYEGAPTPVTAFMAAGVKTAAFAVLVRVALAAYAGPLPQAVGFSTVLAGLALISMIFGNWLALTQKSVKRMLAYSSIAHAGYLLVGVVSAAAAGARQGALSAILFYLASYTATVIGAFAVVAVLERRGKSLDDEPVDAWDLERFAGLGRKRPGLAFAMSVFMVSLAGVPTTAGFIGKLLVFQAAISAQAYGLAVVGMLTSALGAYYYLRVVVYMYMRPAEDRETGLLSPSIQVAVALAVLAVIALGVSPETLSQLARAAATIGM